MEKNPSFEQDKKFIKMYEIPGMEEISEHSLVRYQNDNENFPKDIERVPFSLEEYAKNEISAASVSRKKQDEIEEEMKEDIKGLTIEEIPEYVRRGLDSSDKNEQWKAVRQIPSAIAGERTELLRKAFSIQDEEIGKECVKIISNIPENERRSFIQMGIEKESPSIKKAAINMIKYAPALTRTKMIQIGLTSGDKEIQKEYAKVISSVPDEKSRKELLDIAKQKLGNELVEPPLYGGYDIDDQNFKREKFKKTGSDLTLVGGDLKDKVIFRSITSDSFLEWQQAFENHEIWRRAGFEYVPVEPILSFHFNKDELVDVASGVLDISLGKWMGMSGDYVRELTEQRNKIIKVLEDQGIIHGHTHDDNFCLRFFRKKNGDVDYQKMPRIYLIDFDRSLSK